MLCTRWGPCPEPYTLWCCCVFCASVLPLVWGEREQDHGSWLVQDEGGALYKVSTMFCKLTSMMCFARQCFHWCGVNGSKTTAAGWCRMKEALCTGFTQMPTS